MGWVSFPKGELDGTLIAITMQPIMAANNSMLIASASVDKTVQAWDALTDNHTCTYPDHTGRVLGVTWSPVAKYIASAGEDKIVRVWRLQ